MAGVGIRNDDLDTVPEETVKVSYVTASFLQYVIVTFSQVPFVLRSPPTVPRVRPNQNYLAGCAALLKSPIYYSGSRWRAASS